MRGVRCLIRHLSNSELLFPHNAGSHPESVWGLGFNRIAGRWMGSQTKKQASEVRTGNILDVDGKLVQVLKHSYTQGTGRQLGNVQLDLKELLTGTKRPLRLRPSDMLSIVRLDERKFQFLYREGSMLHCMDLSTFEQLAIESDVIGPSSSFLTEGGEITLEFHDGIPLSGFLPSTVTLRVVEVAPHAKGDTASPSYVPAQLESGTSVLVPPFVETGDMIVIDTHDGKFVKRG